MGSYQLVSSPWLRKILPGALAVTAGAGVIGTAYLAAKATPKALAKKAEAEKKKGEPLTTWETIGVMGPSYIPAIGTGLITIGSIAGMAISSNRKQAELGAIIAGGNHLIDQVSRKYQLLRDDVEKKDPELLKEFDSKSLEDEWEEYVKERRKKVGSCFLSECLPIEDSREWGETRRFCIEYGNGLTDENGHELYIFEATPGDVLAAFYNLNMQFFTQGEACMNDLFHYLNLPGTDLGAHLFWDADALFEDWGTEFIAFSTKDVPMEDNVPEPAVCTEIIFYSYPTAEGYAEAMGFRKYQLLVPCETEKPHYAVRDQAVQGIGYVV